MVRLHAWLFAARWIEKDHISSTTSGHAAPTVNPVFAGWSLDPVPPISVGAFGSLGRASFLFLNGPKIRGNPKWGTPFFHPRNLPRAKAKVKKIWGE